MFAVLSDTAVVALLGAATAFLQAATLLILQRVKHHTDEVRQRTNRRDHEEHPPPDGRYKRSDDEANGYGNGDGD